MTWNAATDARLMALRGQGTSFSEIGMLLGVTKDAAQKRHRRLVAQMAESDMQDEGGVGSALDALGIKLYEIPSLKNTKPLKSGKVRHILSASDHHFGQDTYDPRTEAILVQVAEDLQPDMYVANGDQPDLLAISRYPRDVRTDGPLEQEIMLTKRHYARMREALPAAARIVETNANHSGEGIESRWWRYLSMNIPALMSSPTMREMLKYTNVFHDPKLNIEIADHVELVPGFIAIHGDVVRSHASFSAKAMLEKWRVNLLMGHTHRMGSYGYRVPAIGDKKEHQMRAFEGGCMCKLTAPYLSVANWQQGFTIIHHDGENFNVEQVLIHDGSAVVGSLGKVYHA